MPGVNFEVKQASELSRERKPRTRLAQVIGEWRLTGRGPSNMALAMSQVPESENEVEVRGEALARVLWQGEQWAVTEHGIEARDGAYQIAAKRLGEMSGDHTWVHQMAGKGWVNVRDFALAYAIACAVFEVPFDRGAA